MRTLNDPPGYEREDDDWSPARGERRALLTGIAAAALILAPLAALTWLTPFFIFAWYTRTAIAIGITFGLISLAQRAAGMTSLRIIATAGGLAFIVLVITHIIVAVRGFDDLPQHDDEWTFPLATAIQYARSTDATAGSSIWLHPIVLLINNALPLVGIIAAGWWKRAVTSD